MERFNRTLLMMLAMFAGENRDNWDDLLPAVMMVSSVHWFQPISSDVWEGMYITHGRGSSALGSGLTGPY